MNNLFLAVGTSLDHSLLGGVRGLAWLIARHACFVDLLSHWGLL